MTFTKVAPTALVALRRALGAQALAMASWLSMPALAQTLTVYEEQGQLVRGSRNITAIGHDALGDRINPYTGSLEFVQTDFALPGNHNLPVGVGRRLKTGSTFWQGAHFADWELEIPHLKGTFSSVEGWTVDQWGANRTKRCSLFDAPGEAPTQTLGARVLAESFWKGNFLVVPGAGEQEMLRRAAGNALQPADGHNYPVVTKAGWQFRCLASLANGWAGEGFVALSPDGTQYQFDWLVTRPTNSYTSGVSGGGGGGLDLIAQPRQRPGMALAQAQRIGSPPTNDVGVGNFLARDDVLLLPTRVTDRLGNTVTYSYHPTRHWQLLSIAASDGRTVSFTYEGTSQRISTASTAGRTWTYTYGGSPLLLTSVSQPDGRQWQFSGNSLQSNPSYSSQPAHCDSKGTFTPQPLTKTLVHPSGLSGSFTLSQTLHARSFVPSSCPTAEGANVNRYPVFFVNRSISQKTLSGPGLATLSWSFDYGIAQGGVLPCTGCSGTKTVLVTDARGHVTRHVYGNRWGQDEGQLQRLDEGWSGASGTALRSTTYSYRAANAGPYPAPPGISLMGRGDNDVEAQHRPQDQRVVAQQGATFTWQATAFDTLARPTAVSQFSSLGHSRTELTAYFDLPAKWVMGQRASTTVAGIESQRTSFDPTTGLPTAKYEFGKLKASYQFHADGTLWRLTDGRGNTSTYTNYKRGLAQNIAYADGASESAVVNDLGLVTSLSNARGFTTNYGYDVAGRLNLITPPTSDGIARNPTSLVFEPVASAEYGIAGGHWRQTITTGAGKTVNYFDALLRPRVSAALDNNDAANTQKVTMRSFDADGRVVFESYPQRSLVSVASPPAGTGTTYDALGRAILRVQDSELGLLQTTTSYNSGFTRTVTNPRGQATTTWFQAFDQPSEDLALRIDAPENLRVVFVRDAFGKATSITRSDVRGGAYPSATRSYVYDSNHLLCKTIEPEIGATVETYDAANNVAWRATGLALTSLACDRDSVPLAKRIAYSYDARNRLLATTYGDGSPAITRSYDAAGNLASINSNGTAWTYAYTALNQPRTETLGYGAQVNTITWGYNPNGHVSSLGYPDGTVSYALNALGEITAIGGYASGISYHPNGAVAGYTLANGVAHSLSLNTRGLPLVNRDAGVMQDQYSYDANGNVAAITDQQEGVTSRALGYDGLDRLSTANAPSLWGSGSYSYDVLDNLRSSTLGGRSTVYTYDANNRLSTLNINGAYTGFSFDAQGNVNGRGTQGYYFDQGNRLQLANGIASYVYDGHGRRVVINNSGGGNSQVRLQMYSQGGQLLYGTTQQGANVFGTRYVYLGSKQIAESSAGVTTFAHTDALGSPVARTTAAGALQSRTRFEPYGSVAAGTIPGTRNQGALGFTGHVNDADTGLVYMQQRYYDPIAGRFLSVDPVTTNAKDGSFFGRYHYANNNPYKFVDPDGRAGALAACAAGPVGCAVGVVVTVASAARALFVASAAGAAIIAANQSSSEGSAPPDAATGAGESSDGGKSRNAPPPPLPEAEGLPHSIVERPGSEGQYTTHNWDGTSKQYRGSGKDHGPIPRPNVKEAGKNVTPDGREFIDKGRVRPARPEEIPKDPK